MTTATTGKTVFLPHPELDRLIEELRRHGYSVIAPVEQDGAISLRPLSNGQAVAGGRSDSQEPGKYRVVAGDSDLTFEYVVGPNGIKEFLFPPKQTLCAFHVQGERFKLDASPPAPPKLAFVGVRPCDLAGMKVQDRVFGADDPATLRCESETYYTETRRQAFVVAVNCTRPGGTCFCASMGTGPQATDSYDLALTELRGGFVVNVGSDRGAEMLRNLNTRSPTSAELELEELKLNRAREHMGRTLDTNTLRERLGRSLHDPHWEDVAKRCLSCGNCTMVCPTCFCSTVTDTTDLTGKEITRARQWESCFTHQFSYTTAGPVRNTIRGRYRHWLRHKLCTWWDQFQCGGCVGCGRCITWCPVGIDITAEAQRIGQSASVASGDQARAAS